MGLMVDKVTFGMDFPLNALIISLLIIVSLMLHTHLTYHFHHECLAHYTAVPRSSLSPNF